MVRLFVATVNWHKSLQFVKKSNLTLLPCSFMMGTKTFRGLLHHIRMSFVQERVHTGCHTITSVKYIRNESFLSEFIGVFITERNTHSGQPFLPVQCKRGTALIFV